jgi:hypothetical protein
MRLRADEERHHRINRFRSKRWVSGGGHSKEALFIYLIQKHGFHQLPTDTDDDSFVDGLLREKNDPSELLHFLGAYAYLVETFMKAHSDLFYVSVPESIPRVPISTPPFSKSELETISRYDKNYLRMTE